MTDILLKLYAKHMEKYPNEMLWNILNNGSSKPEQTICWAEKSLKMTIRGITSDIDQRHEILKIVDHFLANMVKFYFSKDLPVADKYLDFYNACLKVKNLI